MHFKIKIIILVLLGSFYQPLSAQDTKWSVGIGASIYNWEVENIDISYLGELPPESGFSTFETFHDRGVKSENNVWWRFGLNRRVFQKDGFQVYAGLRYSFHKSDLVATIGLPIPTNIHVSDGGVETFTFQRFTYSGKDHHLGLNFGGQQLIHFNKNKNVKFFLIGEFSIDRRLNLSPEEYSLQWGVISFLEQEGPSPVTALDINLSMDEAEATYIVPPNLIYQFRLGFGLNLWGRAQANLYFLSENNNGYKFSFIRLDSFEYRTRSAMEIKFLF